MKEFKIYLEDLKEKKQVEILDFLGLENAEEGNLDVFPLSIIPKPEEF